MYLLLLVKTFLTTKLGLLFKNDSEQNLCNVLYDNY